MPRDCEKHSYFRIQIENQKGTECQKMQKRKTDA